MTIDINTLIGEWPFGEIPYRTADGLLRLMDRHGIDRAAVSSLYGLFYKLCHRANRRLCDEIQGHDDRLIPVGTVNPAFPGWERDLEQCRDEFGCRAVKLFPTYHGYDVAGPECSDAVDAAAQAGLPVMVSVGFEDPRVHHWATRVPAMNVDCLAELLRAKAGRPIVVSSVHTTEVRKLLADAPRADFVVEISHMEGPIMCVQDLVRDIGAGRVLLGTQMPFMNPAGAMLAVAEPGFEEADRAMIMGENAKKLLSL